MGAGEFDRRIRIEQETEVRSESGASSTAWSHHATVWAKVTPRAGTEGFQDSQRTAKQVTEFEIRWMSGLTPKMRIVYDGGIYDISDIAEPERRRKLVIMAFAREVSPGSG